MFKFFGDLKHDTCLYVGKQLLTKKVPNNSAVCACLKSIWGDLSSDDRTKYFDCVILGNETKKLNQREADCSTTSLFLVNSTHSLSLEVSIQSIFVPKIGTHDGNRRFININIEKSFHQFE